MSKTLKQKKDMKQIMEWYDNKRPLYVKLASKIELLIKEILDAEKLVYQSVTSRTKDLKSFKNKASQRKYSDPINQIKDLCGIRIISYVETDVIKIREVIEREFTTDPNHFNDKSDNKFGYRSVHLIATLNEVRSSLLELSVFKDLDFEIQIRTILQHAWAEIEHDRGYKFQSSKLPEQNDIKNRFAVISGILKLADSEFNSIVNDIDKYENDVLAKTKSGNLNTQIDSISLNEYLINKFSAQIDNEGLTANFGKDDKGLDEIIEELNLFGVYSLSDLDSLIPKDFTQKASKEFPCSNFLGIIRSIMMISNIEQYFDKAWREGWNVIESYAINTLDAYNVSYTELFEKLDIETDDIFSITDFEDLD